MFFAGKFKDKAETLTSVARRKSETISQDKSEGNIINVVIGLYLSFFQDVYNSFIWNENFHHAFTGNVIS